MMGMDFISGFMVGGSIASDVSIDYLGRNLPRPKERV